MAMQEQRVKREQWELLMREKRVEKDEQASRENLGNL